MTNAKPQVGGPVVKPAAEPAAKPGAGAPPPPNRLLRKDAERNRQLILGAAKVVFAQRGLGASLEEVAQEAGLGVGTVYRRFPNREALIDALFDDMVASIARVVDESVALPRAWDGLVHFMTAMLESQGRDKALRDMLLARPEQFDEHGLQKEDDVRDRVKVVLDDLVERAQAAGDLRPDVVPTDVALVLIAGVDVVDFTAPAGSDAWRRHLTVMLDGLRARSADGDSGFSQAPLTEEQIEECMTGWKYGTRKTSRRS